MSNTGKLDTGRINQKHRTRNALIEAAAQLMREGRVPSIEEVADAAQVSRATAYRYFPTQAHILAGTAILSANLESETRLRSLMTSGDAASRLDSVVQAFCERFTNNEVAYRTLLNVMLQQSVSQSDDPEQPQVRASRQVYWLQEALSPVQRQLGAKRSERLVAALIAATGFEAYTALRDTCLLDPTAVKEVMRWTARSLLQQALAEVKA